MQRGILAALVAAGLVLCLGTAVQGGSTNGRAGQMPAYYDAQLFTINLMQLPPGGEQNNLEHNKSINTIYFSDAQIAGQGAFVSVLDAIQGDGFNPLWQEVDISFNGGVTPVQYTSDDAIRTAAAANQITLTTTNELYRCSVVGRK